MSKMIAPEKCLQLYLSLKTHFTSEKYDAVKYNGRINNADKIHLAKRRDASLINSFARKFENVQQAASFFVANMAYGNEYPFDDEIKSFALYTKWQRNRQSLTKIIKDDIDNIVNSNLQYEELFGKDGGIPALFVLLKNGKVNVETMVVLDHYEKFLDEWIAAKPFWKQDFLRIKKLSSFIKFDEAKFKPLYLNLKEELKKHHA